MAKAQRIAIQKTAAVSKIGLRQQIARDLIRNKYIYLMLVPVVLYYLIFHYGPMYGALMAFQDKVNATLNPTLA